MKIILSIKPEFAEKIFNGSKKFEFRRRIYKNKQIKTVVVYASSPISKVIGEFEIEDVIHDELNSLWQTTSEHSGISRDYYFDYFKGTEMGFAIAVKKAELYDEPVCIKETFGIKPPQSFAYVPTY
ncbi:ASCH domain-containing protein [Roseivirga pacifica]|uniref:ASCH domain-containing protein n=1 Tax=Roseivirga pacifica TaxID=1267423 RepID=UPI0020944D35|nr:ASCH domain-containing protein [Roseivirga pacifica]MCO6360338.1 ASCH domain-containing protein [Roseivirga pacifica]MCO6368227.1 ASCH domain-containing protein [Roseivirga pacifica]MCO6372369.1 ASCH domain-containing protein [Roseivirga pacifica]MCO6376427.1 ASCH domain-containing protein [Roseivirga pacifica]MCO6378293.1 ASCH domain-containing protein [Roseivirga pacifica]